jgi:sec-independent protein translocase protein TatA
VDVGPAELLIVLLVVLVLFGGAKIPQLARSLGRAQKEFKAGLHDDATADDESKPAEPPADGR